MVSTWIGYVIEFSEISLTGKVEYRHVGFSQKLDLDTRNSSTLYSLLPYIHDGIADTHGVQYDTNIR
jgi:hypothetical protein